MSGRDPFCRLENSGDLMGGDGAGGGDQDTKVGLFNGKGH